MLIVQSLLLLFLFSCYKLWKIRALYAFLCIRCRYQNQKLELQSTSGCFTVLTAKMARLLSVICHLFVICSLLLFQAVKVIFKNINVFARCKNYHLITVWFYSLFHSYMMIFYAVLLSQIVSNVCPQLLQVCQENYFVPMMSYTNNTLMCSCMFSHSSKATIITAYFRLEWH